MHTAASERYSLWRIPSAAAILTIVLTGLIPLAARAEDPPERLSPGQREELERHGGELFKSGVQFHQNGENASALEKIRQALDIRERLYSKKEHPDGHRDLAENLSWVGFLLDAQGRYGEARVYDERALAMRQSLYPKERYPQGHTELAESLINLGLLLKNQEAYGEARERLERALAMRQHLYPKEKYPQGHPDLATTLDSLGSLLQFLGAYSEARERLERALAMRQHLYPTEKHPQGHPDLATSLNNLGMVLQEQGAYAEGREHLERALAMRQAQYTKARYPQGHPDVANSLNNLGCLFQSQGAYGAARGYFERALEMCHALYPRERYPHGHPHVAYCLNNLGSLLRAQGAYGEARAYLARALEINQGLYPKERYPQGHPDLAMNLATISALLHSHGAYGEARAYGERALAMRLALHPWKLYPQGHPELARVLSNLGHLLEEQGAYGEARVYSGQALAMKQALYSKERYSQGHPDLVASLNNLGVLLEHQGCYGEALGYFGRALAMSRALYLEKGNPHGHPDLAISLYNLSGLLNGVGAFGEAKPFVQQGVDMQHGLAEILLAAYSEAEAMNYLATLPAALDLLVTVCLRVAGSEEAVYARVWRGKAGVARLLQRRQTELFHQAAADPAAHRDVEAWRDVRGRLARLLLATADGRDHPDRLARLQQLTADKERLERQLAEAIPVFARHQALERSPHTKLVEVIPEHTVVLDLTGFTRFEQDPQIKGKKGKRQTPSYIGFVLAKGRPVRAVDLGPAAPINDAVRTWRTAIKGRQASPAAEIIRRLVWEPLARQFAPETTTVVLALDGLLTAVPWAALPGGRPGTVLLEQYTLATVPHAPFLLDRLTALAPPTDERGVLLAVGGVAYDLAPKPVEDEKTKLELLAVLPAETARGRGDDGKELAGTLDERNAVTQLAGSRTVVRLEGAGAGAAQLLRDLPRARWAHIATHGFFADPSIPSVLRPDLRLFSAIGRENVGAGLRNPLVLSGLVLAGANRPRADIDASARDDLGILTAEAIAGLPLQDLELVVLSACETGLGLVGGGEGVFGLQRAFHLAGAHNVVASLWNVDDQATAALMAIFYDQLWRQHNPPIEALRTAQLTLYRHPGLINKLAKARGTPDFDKLVKRPEPSADHGKPALTEHAPIEQWAAFVLSGWGR
jgi:CHAT domain-containing protein/tetratricopeptide (TPR) repeat protein